MQVKAWTLCDMYSIRCRGMRQKHGLLLKQGTECVLCLAVIAEIRTALNLAWPLISQSRTPSAKQFTVVSVARCPFACSRIGNSIHMKCAHALRVLKQFSEDVCGLVRSSGLFSYRFQFLISPGTTLCSLIDCYRNLGGTCCLCLHSSTLKMEVEYFSETFSSLLLVLRLLAFII
jgi:hypothetical protein